MDKKKEIIIHNIKNPNFKQAHTDGASAGITPQGYLNINFYNERNVIPKGTIFELNTDGTLGANTGVTEDSKVGMIREYDFGIFIDINTCKSIVELLNLKIKEHEAHFSVKK